MIGTCNLLWMTKKYGHWKQVKQFVDSSQGIEFSGLNPKEKYLWTEEVLRKFKYPWLKKKKGKAYCAGISKR